MILGQKKPQHICEARFAFGFTDMIAKRFSVRLAAEIEQGFLLCKY